MKGRHLAYGLLVGAATGGAVLLGPGSGGRVEAAPPTKPNIIFILLDDVGIDQMAMFGNGGVFAAKTPNMEIIARRGIKFTNAWAMPECSPSRSAAFTGRYPIRTGVEAVIVDNSLPQSYMSSFEATLPRVLTKAGYTNSLVGKYHLGDTQDPAGSCAPASRGFQNFQGAMTPGPPSVDTTAGGIYPEGTQACGYYQGKAPGACYTTPGDSVRCSPIDASTAAPGTDPARTCLQQGGIFVPNKACGVGGPTYSDFSKYNAYYVWPRTVISGALDPLYVNTNDSCQPQTSRDYMTIAQGNDGIDWWKQQTGPRMLTLSFNAMHTPYQKAPTDLVPDPTDAAATCNNLAPQRRTLNSILEGADVQIGRTLAALGLGTMGPDGLTLRSLNLRNTLVVIMGDNGTQGLAVRAPFNPLRAKATVYQTGVWVPLIVSGSMVVSPGRSVDDMVNIVDLYQLFGDVAGVDVHSIVPPSHVLDSKPMLPYLLNPGNATIRQSNFTQSGVGIASPVPEQRSWPCQIGGTCNDTLIDNPSLCENDNGGTYFGPGGKGALTTSCCKIPGQDPSQIAPVHQYAIRGGQFRGVKGAFKLVQNVMTDCTQPITNASQPKAFPWAEYLTTTTQDFYDLTLTVANPKGLDNANTPSHLSQNCPAGSSDLTNCLPTQIDVRNYKLLNKELATLLNSANSQNKCASKGDGNMDQRVTQADIAAWKTFNGKGPSRYDINLDGATDEKDLAIIQANLGLDCMTACKRADLNHDGKVTSADMTLLKQQAGICSDAIFCGGDLDGDGRVNRNDVSLMNTAIKTCN